MHIAAREGRDYTVEFIVKQGANIHIQDKKGVSMTEGRFVQLIRVRVVLISRGVYQMNTKNSLVCILELVMAIASYHADDSPAYGS